MSIMSALQKWKENKAQFKELQRRDKFDTVLAERKKNSNERELDRFVEEERQKQIKIDLEHYRKKRQADIDSMRILGGKNIFKAKSTMLVDNKKLFASGAPILNNNKRLNL